MFSLLSDAEARAPSSSGCGLVKIGIPGRRWHPETPFPAHCQPWFSRGTPFRSCLRTGAGRTEGHSEGRKGNVARFSCVGRGHLERLLKSPKW